MWLSITFGALTLLNRMVLLKISGKRINTDSAIIKSIGPNTKEIPRFNNQDGGLGIISCKSSEWISSAYNEEISLSQRTVI
jgi:hypothetical protein